MKTITKLMLAGTALAAAGAANAATINVVPTAPTGSDLVLFVTDTTASVGFIQDLGVTVDSLGVTTASGAADVANGIAYNSFGSGSAGTLLNPVGTNGVDASLATFLSAHTGDNFVYGFEAAGTGDGSINAGQGRAVASFTSANSALLFGSEPGSGDAHDAAQQINSFFANINNNNAPLYGASTGTGAQNTSIYGVLTDAALGTSVYLSELVTGGSSADANIYTSSALKVSLGGMITGFASGGTAPVPLPAAIWLLGSGLVGLFGVGRRRLAAAVG